MGNEVAPRKEFIVDSAAGLSRDRIDALTRRRLARPTGDRRVDRSARVKRRAAPHPRA